MPEQVVEVKDIVTEFPNNRVHDGVSFSVEKGTIVALIGGSGSGKSVLLKEIIGLLKPKSGAIKLFGEETVGASEEMLARLRQRYGVLFQNGALFSAISSGDNVAVPLREKTSLPDSMIEEIVKLRLTLSGLDANVFDKMPSELSGGMRKRVALARALALEPELLFLDEPTSGLDPITARAFDSLIRTLCSNLGLTVLIVTHDLDTLHSVVDKVVVLGDKKVLAEGPVTEISKSEQAWIKSYFSTRGHT